VKGIRLGCIPAPARGTGSVLKKDYVRAILLPIRLKRVSEEWVLNPVDED
jgi:hypothetical protein